MEDSDWNVLVLKKNLCSRDDSVIIRVKHDWEAEDEAVGKLQVVCNGLVVTLLHESRKRGETTYVSGTMQGRGYSRFKYCATASFHFKLFHFDARYSLISAS